MRFDCVESPAVRSARVELASAGAVSAASVTAIAYLERIHALDRTEPAAATRTAPAARPARTRCQGTMTGIQRSSRRSNEGCAVIGASPFSEQHPRAGDRSLPGRQAAPRISASRHATTSVEWRHAGPDSHTGADDLASTENKHHAGDRYCVGDDCGRASTSATSGSPRTAIPSCLSSPKRQSGRTPSAYARGQSCRLPREPRFGELRPPGTGPARPGLSGNSRNARGRRRRKRECFSRRAGAKTQPMPVPPAGLCRRDPGRWRIRDENGLCAAPFRR